MEKGGFEIGQLAEMKSFQKGYRSAWFRCKIKDIDLKEEKILPHYYDFDPTKLIWEKLYRVPRGGRKSKNLKRHLMVRPQYPMMYKKSEMPPLDSVSQVCVVYDGTWKVGDLVDWFTDGCYWSVTVVKVLSNDKFLVELPMPPLGDGKKGEEGKHEASCNEFRPSLIWSATEGWALPTVEGRTSCDARLIFPRKQGFYLISGMDLEPEPVPVPATAGSTTRTLAAGDKDSEQNEGNVEMDCDVDMDLDSQPGTEPEPAAAGSTTLIKSAEGDGDSEQNEKSVKTDCDVMESSDSISSFQKKVAADEVEKRELNVMHEDTLEAAVMDLQELVTKVKWMQRLLQAPSSGATPSSWKFV